MVVKKQSKKDKSFSEMSGKLHIPCPFKEQTGISTHVVIRGRYCYRSDDCLVIQCKYNRHHNKIEDVLSVTW